MKFEELVSSIKKRSFKPLYLLHGEEPYYIDQIAELASQNILSDGERDFNQTIFYARDTQPMAVIDTALRLPMMSEFQVVIVREAQDYSKASQWEQFEKYFDNPAPQTILIFAHKYKTLDKRFRSYKLLEKKGIIFESPKVKDYQVPDWVKNHVIAKKYQITDKAVALICEFIGSDLGRIANEVEKLMTIVPVGTQINEKHIEQHIGISKDYNVFELVNAVADRNVMKANRIVNYFGQNPKATHSVVVIANLLAMYQRMFKAHFAQTEDPAKLASLLKVAPFAAKEIVKNKKKHPAKIISRNFSILREYDMLSKGVGSAGLPDGELMKELIFKLLH
ncbi:MAG: DNA polymerase III subunit delta [Crocinitomicaceae bacterium]|nr:DNA polymerase III subunit delta [Crocinitomicaceae bacterium]MBK8924366.1 DNA polymerase III subunit delta [Crocinitomicaceae bacterium]